jgi:hypothetical protein
MAEVNQTANAIVTELADPGADDGTGDVGTGSPVWAGTAHAFLKRERRTKPVGDVEEILTVDTLRIFDTEGIPTAFKTGSPATAQTIVVDDRRGGVSEIRRWTIVGVLDRNAHGTLDSTLLELARPEPVT